MLLCNDDCSWHYEPFCILNISDFMKGNKVIGMKVLLFCAKGFETMEFSVFVDVFGWAENDYGYPVQVVTCGFRKEVVSTFHVPIIVDRLIDEIVVDEYDALAIPGGFEEFGFYEEAYDERLLDLIRAFNEQNKIILL